MDLKLRISLELYLKRLLVGGSSGSTRSGRNFRNEGIDREHNPEFTMLELYEAYGDYETMMLIAEDLIRACALAVNGALASRSAAGSSIWRRRSADHGARVVSEATGEEVTLDRPDLRASPNATASASTRRGGRARSSWRSSRSSSSTRSSSPRSSATTLERSRRSHGRTAPIPRSPSTSTSSSAGSSWARLSGAHGSDRAACEVRAADGHERPATTRRIRWTRTS